MNTDNNHPAIAIYHVISIDFTNHLLKVVAHPMKKMITCEFYHKSTATKLCSVTYFDEHCQSKLYAVNGSTTGNSLNLYYTVSGSNELKRLCFVVAADNGTMRVNISGIFIHHTGIKLVACIVL